MTTIVTSAVVAAIVTSITGLFSQWRDRVSREDQGNKERDARRRELLLKSAIDMARSTLERAGEAAHSAPVRGLESVLARRHFAALASLFDTGKLTPELEREMSRLERIADMRTDARDEQDSIDQAADAIWNGRASALPAKPPAPKDEETDKDTPPEKK